MDVSEFAAEPADALFHGISDGLAEFERRGLSSATIGIRAASAGARAVYRVRRAADGPCVRLKAANDAAGGFFFGDKAVKRYLTCIDAATNKYKFYSMSASPHESSFSASFGRIGGASVRRCRQPIELFWPKLAEKLCKGYADQTALYKADGRGQDTAADSGDVLYERLAALARGRVVRELDAPMATAASIDAARARLEDMRAAATLGEFNDALSELLVLSPRKADGRGGVGGMLAADMAEKDAILEREESLFDALDSLFTGDGGGEFGLRGISVFPATDSQRAVVLSHLSSRLKGKVRQVWRIIDGRHKPAFDAYRQERGIGDGGVKLFWHGSRNENWLSIVLNSLSLHPDAHRTGSMFGRGLYFAPSSEKSFGYTSCYGSRWAAGESDTFWMGLYAVAVGREKHVRRYDWQRDWPRYVERDCGCDSLYAESGAGMLHADELVVYHEEAVLLDYLVEFER